MSRPQQNQSANRPPANRRSRRGVEAVFWIVFVLALGVGGPGALAGLPKLADAVVPSAITEAQAAADLKHFVSRPLPPVVRTSPAVTALLRAALPPDVGAEATAAVSDSTLPAIALVIDDMGVNAEQTRRAIALPAEVSLSFLPYPVGTPRLAEEARRAGHEILVHVPMQAPSDRDGSLKQALRRDLPADENIRRLEWALSRVPGYSGINNHEGSVFTADRQALIPVAEALYGRGLYFLDSRTTPLTQIVPVARGFGVPSADRDVFLDDDQSPAAVIRQLKELEKTARQNGVAIAIGHPHAATLDIVARWCAEQKGFRLLPVSAAIRLKTEWDMGVDIANKN